jgi:hypothetical protein
MAKKANSSNSKPKNDELDGVFMLKLVLYLVLGSLWIKITKGNNLQIPIPIGFIVGGFLTLHDHFQIDRKIEYAVLLIAMLIGFWAPFGLYVGLR